MNIKNLFHHIKDFFANFLKGVDKAIIDNADQAIAIAGNIKDYLNSPLIGVITGLIPGTWDEALVAEAKTILDKVMPVLLDIEVCKNMPTESDRYACYLQKISELSPKMQNGFFFKFASTYLIEKHKDLAEHQADAIIQGRYIQAKP